MCGTSHRMCQEFQWLLGYASLFSKKRNRSAYEEIFCRYLDHVLISFTVRDVINYRISLYLCSWYKMLPCLNLTLKKTQTSEICDTYNLIPVLSNNHQTPVNSPHKMQRFGVLLFFSLTLMWRHCYVLILARCESRCQPRNFLWFRPYF